MSVVITEKADGVAVITLNRPEAMNALSRQLRAELAAAIRTTANDDDVRVLIITGAGERAFTAGVDLKELSTQGFTTEADPADDPVVAMDACAKPIIAAVNGVAITGGLELALACDIMLASSNARFADTHVRVGVMPGWGLSQRLPRLIGPSRAKEMSLSGNFIDAQTALDWGVVNRVVAPDELLDTARTLAADIASCPPANVARYKSLIDDGYALSFADGLALEATRSAQSSDTFDRKSLNENRSALQDRGRAQAPNPAETKRIAG